MYWQWPCLFPVTDWVFITGTTHFQELGLQWASTQKWWPQPPLPTNQQRARDGCRHGPYDCETNLAGFPWHFQVSVTNITWWPWLKPCVNTNHCEVRGMEDHLMKLKGAIRPSLCPCTVINPIHVLPTNEVELAFGQRSISRITNVIRKNFEEILIEFNYVGLFSREYIG